MPAILDDVNPEQRAAITHGKGPLLVVAGAGSGKTRVITRRVAHLVRQGAAPGEIVALTFTNKAAREMSARVRRLVRAPDLWIRTFHSFAARVLRRYPDLLGYTREFSIYDTEDKRRLIRRILKETHADELRPAEVALALTRKKNAMERPGAGGWRAERVSKVMVEYEARMRASNAMDFDDLLCNLRRLLDEQEAVRERLMRRARWLLVDEYQDTNTVQYGILRRLAGPERNVCATGDPDQSIYRWRGATIRNILDFEEDFPGARRITLDRNYRSTRAVLAVANAVIRNNRDRFEKELRTSNEEGVPVREVRAFDEGDEARRAAQAARDWIDGGRRPGEVAFFYRVNAQSRALERALAELRVPYRIIGTVEFYKRKEVKDLLAYVRVARNPSDSGALARIFNLPPRGLGKKTEERLLAAAAAKGVPPREILRNKESLARFSRARKPLARLAELLDAIEALDPDDPRSFLERTVALSGYREYLGAHTASAEVERLENLDELVNAGAEYAAREPEGGIDGFLEENALVSDQDTLDDSLDRVTLMTVHAAKGLEFPCVAVCGLEEQLFPHALSLESEEEVAEERRLFYVAATRAKKELILLHAARRMHQGRFLPCQPSRFLDEIPDDLLALEDHTFTESGDEEPEFRVQEEPPFRSGDRVKHGHFGFGRVVAVRKSGGATKITVQFATSGRRELSLTYARLERL